MERHFGSVKVPAFITGGWSDLFSIGTVRSFEGMRQQGGSGLARDGSMLIMQGTAAHGGPGVIEPSPENNVVNVRALQLRFYDRYVKGLDNGIDREPRVRLFVRSHRIRATRPAGSGSTVIRSRRRGPVNYGSI